MFPARCMRPLAAVTALFVGASLCIRFDPEQVLWNLNQNRTATDVMDYWGQWENHSKGGTFTDCALANPSQHTLLHQTTGGFPSTLSCSIDS